MSDTAPNGNDHQEVYQALMHPSPPALFLIRLNGFLMEANQVSCDLFGYTKEELLKKQWQELVDGQQVPFHQVKAETAQNGSFQSEATGIKKNGETFPVFFSVVGYPSAHSQDLLCVILTDLSPKKHFEQQLNNLLEKSRQLYTKAEDERLQLFEVLESIPQGFLLTDAAARITYWNQQAGQLTGFSRQQVLGKSLWDVFSGEKAEKFRQAYNRASDSPTPVQFEEFIPASGMWLEITLSPAAAGLSVSLRDITNRKKAQENIILHEQKLAQIYNNVEDVIYLYDVENHPQGRRYKFESINNSFLKATGLKEEEVAGRYVEEVIPEPSLTLVLANYEKAIQTGKTVRWQEVTPYPSGVKTGLVAITPIYDEQHTCIKLIGSVHDITAIRQAEKKIEASNERYQYATAATKDAIYDWNINTGEVEWGTGFIKLFGFKRSQLRSTIYFWRAHLFPGEREAVFNSLISSTKNSAQQEWQREYRFCRADGTYAYVIDQGFIIRDKGRAVRMVGALQDISERKKAEEELRKLSLIAHKTVNGVIVTDAQGHITWTNEAFTRISGYQPGEAVGKKPGSLLQGKESDPNTVQYMHDQIKKQEPFWCEIINYTKSGAPYWVKIQGQPVFDEKGDLENYFSILTDITRQKQEEIKLRLLESSITNATDSIMIVEPVGKKDKDFKIVFTNAAFTRITGYPAEDVTGHPPEILLGPESNPAEASRFFRALKHFQPCEVEIILYKKSGEKFWSQLSTFPIQDNQGEFTHCNIIQRDISSRKAREEERERMLALLTQTNEDLKQFSFITSHNLNAPIANLIGILNLINKETISDPATLLLLEKFRESTLKLNDIIQDLTDILVVRNPWQTKTEWLDLSTIFDEVVRSVDHLLSEIDATITTDFSKGKQVFYSAEYLRSILINLLTNAIKYRSAERKLVIDVKTEVRHSALFLYFSDNGSGIDLKRYGNKIFGLYQRFHKSHHSKGMGLFMIRSQIKSMGGNITVASEVGQGTVFTIRFNTPGPG